MDFLNELIQNIWIQRVFWSIIAIVVSVIIYGIISHFINRHERKKTKLSTNKKSRTLIRMIKSIIRYVIIILDILIILQIFGVDVSSMLAAAGIAGIIIGFAIKDALQDIFRGFNIISDNYYNVGDIVKVNNYEGKVLAIGLMTTKIHDTVTGNMVSIANRNIIEAEVMSGVIDIDIPLPYEINIDRAEKILTEIAKQVSEQEYVTEAEYRKIANYSNSSLDYRIRVVADPALRVQVRRDCLDTIAKALAAHKISIPYPQLDLHTKK